MTNHYRVTKNFLIELLNYYDPTFNTSKLTMAKMMDHIRSLGFTEPNPTTVNLKRFFEQYRTNFLVKEANRQLLINQIRIIEKIQNWMI